MSPLPEPTPIVIPAYQCRMCQASIGEGDDQIFYAYGSCQPLSARLPSWKHGLVQTQSNSPSLSLIKHCGRATTSLAGV